MIFDLSPLKRCRIAPSLFRDCLTLQFWFYLQALGNIYDYSVHNIVYKSIALTDIR